MSNFSKAVLGVASNLRDRLDSWQNAITGLGGARDKTRANQMGGLFILRPNYLEHLYQGDDLAATICEALPEACFSKGFSVSQDEEGKIDKALTKWKAIEKTQTAAVWGRTFGGGALLLGVDRARMDQPLELDRVQAGDLKYIMVLDRRDLTVDDHYSLEDGEKYGEPRTYRVNKTTTASALSADGLGYGTSIHESRLILFGGERTTERMRQNNGGWDVSVLQRPYEVLKDANTNWSSAVYLLSDASQAVMKIKGLIDMIAEGDVETMQNRMEIVNSGRSIAKAVVLDAEMESFEQIGAANLAGVSDILAQTWLRLAAAARMPVTVLMGKSPDGMNATGASDLALWFGRVGTYQERVLGPALVKLVQIVAASEGIALDEDPTIDWPPQLQESPKDQASARKTVAETDKIYVEIGALTPAEVTKARWGQGEYSPDTAQAVDMDAHEQALEKELEDLLNPPEPPPVIVAPPAPVEGAPPVPEQDPELDAGA